jgi:DnaJ-domain-containing protein 1
MSLPERLLRIARQALEELADGLREPRAHADARDELESYLAGPRYQPKPPPPPPPPDPLKPYYDAVGAPVGADLATVEKAWRRRVLENHPDRFMHDPAEQQRASDRLRRLNAAHEVLERELSRREKRAG